MTCSFFVAASGRCSSFSCHYELSSTAVDRKEVGDKLPGNSNRGPIGVALLLFRVIDQRQIRAEARSQFSCLDQHRLQMPVSLFRDWHALDRLRRTSLCAAQSAVTNSLLHRVKSSYIADLKHPGQRGDRTDCRDRHQPFDTRVKQWTAVNERTSAPSVLPIRTM